MNGYLHLIQIPVITNQDFHNTQVLYQLFVVALDSPDLPPGHYNMQCVSSVEDAKFIANKHDYQLINKGNLT